MTYAILMAVMDGLDDAFENHLSIFFAETSTLNYGIEQLSTLAKVENEVIIELIFISLV